jgi:predicted RNase H-like HicB family nuclease
MKARYPINIAWSDEDDCYIAHVPALPSCVGHGDTYKEAVANIEDSIDGFLASMKEHGDKIPEPDRPPLQG